MKSLMTRKISPALCAAALAGLLAPIASSVTTASALPAGLQRNHMRVVRADVKYDFQTLNNATDPTFNQLLGINNAGTICGYYGSGAAGHPNKGYTLLPPYTQANYTNENFPGSAQTQVVGIDNIGNTAGFWIDGAGANFGFVEWNGVFTSYRHPLTKKGTVNQLLGINDNGMAAGFYVNGKGVSHAYTLNQQTGKFTAVVPPGGSNAVAAGINNAGDVTGFLTSASGLMIGFLMKNGAFSTFVFPGATATTPFGLNNSDQIVGSYLDAKGASHGFVLTNPLKNANFRTVDDPHGIGTTVINGTNDNGQLVGFYVDVAGNTNGFLANPH